MTRISPLSSAKAEAQARWRTVRDVVAVVVALFLLMTVVTAKGGDPGLYPAMPGQGVAIFLVDNGFHSDIAVPREAAIGAGGAFARATAETTAQPWVLIGWGDARFYEDQSPWQGRIPDGVRALFGGRPTVVHLEGISERPDLAWRDGVTRIVVSPAGLAALLARADAALLRDGDEPIASPIPHPPDEGFFRSGEGFSGVHLCNHWAAELLNAAGLPTTAVIDTLPAGLRLDLKLRAGV